MGFVNRQTQLGALVESSVYRDNQAASSGIVFG